MSSGSSTVRSCPRGHQAPSNAESLAIPASCRRLTRTSIPPRKPFLPRAVRVITMRARATSPHSLVRPVGRRVRSEPTGGWPQVRGKWGGRGGGGGGGVGRPRPPWAGGRRPPRHEGSDPGLAVLGLAALVLVEDH